MLSVRRCLVGTLLIALALMSNRSTALAQSTPPQLFDTVDLTSFGAAVDPDVVAEGSSVYMAWSANGSFDKPDIFFTRSLDEGRTFETIVPLSDNAGESIHVRLAVSGLDVYAVWQDDTSPSGIPRIRFRRSLDGGVNWQAEVTLPSEAELGSRRPAVAATGPEVYAVWEETIPAVGTADPTAIVLNMTRSLDQGKTFSEPVRFRASPSKNLRPAIAATGSAVYIVWQAEPDVAERPDIFFTRSLDEGETFPVDNQNLSEWHGGAESSNPSIAATGAAVFVAWEDHSPGAGGIPDVRFRISSSQGYFFYALDSLSRSPSRASTAPRVAANGARVSFVWQERIGINYETVLLALSYMAPGVLNVNQQSVVNLSKTANSSVRPVVALAGSATYVAWLEAAPIVDDFGHLYFSRSALVTGAAIPNLSRTPDRESTLPDVAADGQSVYMVWAESTDSFHFDTYFRNSQDGGRTFGVPVNLSANSGESTNAQVATAGQVVYVVWADDTDTPGTGEIFFRRSLDRGRTWDPPLSDPAQNLGRGAPDALPSLLPTVAAIGGEVYVAWEDELKIDETTTRSVPQVFFRRALAGGGSLPFDWDPILTDDPKQLTCVATPLCKGRMPHLAVAGANVYHIWQIDNLGVKRIILNLSVDQEGPVGVGGTGVGGCGDAGLDKTIVGVADSDPMEPRVAANGSAIHAVWRKQNEILYRRAEVDGSTCTWFPPLDMPPVRFSAGDHVSQHPNVAVSGLDVYVTWSEDTSRTVSGSAVGAVRFARSTDGGLSFTVPGLLMSGAAKSARQPDVAGAGPDTFLTWVEADTTPGYFRLDEIAFRLSADEGLKFPLTTCTPLVCPQILTKVPMGILVYAVENPELISGFCQLQSLSKLQSPYNSLKASLTLRSVSSPFNWMTNGLVFRAGCP